MSDLRAFHDREIGVLVVKLSALGDVIHATGALRAIRAALPRARVTLAVEDRWRDVVAHHPSIDGLVGSSPRLRVSPGYVVEIRRRLAGHGPFDVALDLQGNARSAAWVYLSGAPVKLGRGGFRPGWRRALRPDLRRHAVEVCADICRSVGIGVDDPSPLIRTGADDEARIDRLLAEAGLPSGGYVVLNPFSRWASKSWPVENAAEVVRRLRVRVPHPLVISGGPDDRDQAALLRRLAGPPHLASLTGRLSLGEALCLFRRARLMVSCDSGPMHASAAFGVSTIGLFGPTHPERTGPWGPCHRVLQASRPPTHHAYRDDPGGTYMRRLDVDTILDAVVDELSREAPP